jgi:phospholipid transport system substrate-binding protein
MLSLFRRGLLVLLAAFPLAVMAAPSAHEVVQQTTEKLLADLKDNKDKYRSDPGAFYDALNDILGPVVDVEGISRSIMTVKYSGSASPEQMARFQDNFKRSLMQFYGNALLEYDNQEIIVVPARGKADPQRASVTMEVKDSKGTVYPVSYSMVKVADRWMMRNVIINGINVGKLFRDQFAQSMQNNRNDLDRVIDTWTQTVARAKTQVESGS